MSANKTGPIRNSILSLPSGIETEPNGVALKVPSQKSICTTRKCGKEKMAAQDQPKHVNKVMSMLPSRDWGMRYARYFHVKPKKNPKQWRTCWSQWCSLKRWMALNPNGVYFYFRRKTKQIKQNKRNHQFQSNLQLQFPAVYAVSPSRPQQNALNSQVLLSCHLQAWRLRGQEALQIE